MPITGPMSQTLQVTLRHSKGRINYSCSTGAFAFFGPSQFATLYPFVTQPVDGILHFSGEATSVHHAYVPFYDDRANLHFFEFVDGSDHRGT